MKITDISNTMTGLDKSSMLGSINSELQNNQNNSNDVTFSSILKESLSELNNTQVKAYEAMDSIATGKVKNLQEAVKMMEQAELSFKLSLEVKNKALGAFKQVMAMQV